MLSSSGLGRGDWIKLQKQQAKAKFSCWDQVNLASAGEMVVGSWWAAWAGTPGSHASEIEKELCSLARKSVTLLEG